MEGHVGPLFPFPLSLSLSCCTTIRSIPYLSVVLGLDLDLLLAHPERTRDRDGPLTPRRLLARLLVCRPGCDLAVPAEITQESPSVELLAWSLYWR